jgi:hypothetical protein
VRSIGHSQTDLAEGRPVWVSRRRPLLIEGYLEGDCATGKLLELKAAATDDLPTQKDVPLLNIASS